MPIYRLKSIEARRVPTEDDAADRAAYLAACQEIAEWCGGELQMRDTADESADCIIAVAVPWGVEKAYPGDYIVKESDGQYYPWKARAFEANYELVEE